MYRIGPNRIGISTGGTKAGEINAGIWYVGAHADGALPSGTANAGDIVLRNTAAVRGTTAAGAAMNLIQVNASDIVLVGNSGNELRLFTPTQALGGGAAATLGTIGGSGPTAAAQNKWVQMFDNGGTRVWIPVWV